MDEKTEEIIWNHLIGLASLGGDLACMMGDNEDLKKWISTDAKETRDRLIKAIDALIKELGLKK